MVWERDVPMIAAVLVFFKMVEEAAETKVDSAMTSIWNEKNNESNVMLVWWDGGKYTCTYNTTTTIRWLLGMTIASQGSFVIRAANSLEFRLFGRGLDSTWLH